MKFDESKGRWRTRLSSGQVLEVKPINLELPTTDTGMIDFLTLKRVAKELGEHMTDEELQEMTEEAEDLSLRVTKVQAKKCSHPQAIIEEMGDCPDTPMLYPRLNSPMVCDICERLVIGGFLCQTCRCFWCEHH